MVEARNNFFSTLLGGAVAKAPWQAQVMGSQTGVSMGQELSRRRKKDQRGFTVLEVVIAVLLIGTGLVAVVSAMGASTRTAVRAEESVTLLQLARAQIETIQQSPFKATASQYPAISNVPEGFTVSFVSADPGTSYTYPAILGTSITGAVQKITVTATGDVSQLALTFYKIRMP